MSVSRLPSPDSPDTPGIPDSRQSPEGVVVGIAAVLTSSYFATALALVRGIVVARILGPTLQGVLSVVNIVLGYASYSDLGLIAGMNKEMPRRLSQGREEEANRLKDTAVSGALLLAGLAGLVPIAYGLLLRRHLGVPTMVGLLLSAGIIFGLQANVLYECLLRTHKQFRLFSLVGAASAVLDFVLLIGLTWLWSIYGALGAVLLKHLLVWLIYRAVTRRLPDAPRFAFRLDLAWSRLRYLALTGVPIAGLNLTDQFLRTADRLAIAKLLGAHDLGFYAAGAMAAGLIYNIPRSVGWVLFPHFLAVSDPAATADGRPADDPEIRKRYLHDQMLSFSLFLATMTPALTGMVYILTPAFIHGLLNSFVPGIPAARGQLAGMALLSLMIPATVQLVALNKEWWVAATRVLTAGFILGGSAYLIRHGAGIAEVSWWMALAMLAYAPGMLLMALLAYGLSFGLALSRAFAALLPPAYCAAAVYLAEHLTHRVLFPVLGRPYTLAALGLTALALYLVLILPLLVWAERRFRLRLRLRGLVRRETMNDE